MSDQAMLPYDSAALKAAHPIAGVVAGAGVALHASGRALVGRCPFHDDRGRPNFYVYPDTGTYYCFRCGAGGDVIDFVRRAERLGFRAACERLAGRPPRPAVGEDRERAPDWERLPARERNVLHAAATVYANRLLRSPLALAYLRGRGVADAVIASGVVGYCIGHDLALALGEDDRRTAARLGILALDGRGRPGERFAGRIVVAERRAGQAIWLIGRAIRAGRPRFLSLVGPRPLLGLERIQGQAEVFLVEGLFDWLTAVGWGLPACSLCGTHGSERQLEPLQGAGRIYAVFDADPAGRDAARRLGERFGPRWRPVPLPAGEDLNDLARRPDGALQFFDLVRRAREMGFTTTPGQGGVEGIR